MYAEAGEGHHIPNFHAYYQDKTAVFAFDPLECIGGTLPNTADPARRDLGRTQARRVGRGLAKPRGRSFSETHCPAVMKTEHAIHRITSFEVKGLHTLLVGFADGTRQLIDFEPLLVGEIFGPLRDPGVFAGVRIDPEAHTLVWPNGADLDPSVLHDWPAHEAAMRARAQQWGGR